MRRLQRGFTLFEALIALSLAVVLSMLAMQVLEPWLSFRQSLDNDQRLGVLREALAAAYKQNLERVDSVSGAVLTLQDVGAPAVTYAPTTVDANRACSGFEPDGGGASANLIPNLAGISRQESTMDGYNNPLCFFASNRLTVERNGVPLGYHVFALVSPGKNGRLEPGTRMDAASGELVLEGDDRGVVVDGRLLQADLVSEASERLARVAKAYETYFTARFLANPSRDISVDYFSRNGAAGGWDPDSVIDTTNGVFVEAGTALAALGLSPDDYTTPYGPIEVGNHSECVTSPSGAHADICVKSPATGAGQLPYTAVLRVRLPNGEYLSHVAVGGY